jgi:hypothetical protein
MIALEVTAILRSDFMGVWSDNRELCGNYLKTSARLLMVLQGWSGDGKHKLRLPTSQAILELLSFQNGVCWSFCAVLSVLCLSVLRHVFHSGCGVHHPCRPCSEGDGGMANTTRVSFGALSESLPRGVFCGPNPL